MLNRIIIGAIIDRDNDKRCIESLLKCLPCGQKISSINLARAIRLEAEIRNSLNQDDI